MVAFFHYEAEKLNVSAAERSQRDGGEVFSARRVCARRPASTRDGDHTYAARIVLQITNAQRTVALWCEMRPKEFL